MVSDVQKFYSGKTIFITGVTGFLGHILLSKFLCSCQGIRCIYVLLRDNAGKTIHERMKEIFDNPIFLPTKQQNPDYETKVKPIRGDCCERNMGISDDDRVILENEVDIVIHVAALVNFSTALKEATFTNVRSLDVLLDIAKNMKKLKAKFIEEKYYNPPTKAKNLLSLVERLDDKVLEEITPRLLTNSYPNSYIYTKLVAEDLCKEKGSDLPLCIFRPVQVVPCYKEPLPGWINNSYGCVGVVLGHLLGPIKVAPVDKNANALIVPGDYCSNALILSIYHTSLSWEGKTTVKLDAPIINYSSCATKFSSNWRDFLLRYNSVSEKYPFYNMVSPPYIKFIKNYTIYRFLAFFLHLIPATICDLVFIVSCKKPRFKNSYRKIEKFLNLIEPFSVKDWIISTNNIAEICTTLSDEDKELFYCDLNELNIEDYFETMIRGIRINLSKDSEETLQKAKAKRKKLWILYSTSILVIFLVIVYFLKSCFDFINS